MSSPPAPIGPVDATRIPRYAGPATFARLPRLDEVVPRRRRRARRAVRLRRELPARAPASDPATSVPPRSCCGRTTRRRTSRRSACSRWPTPVTSP